MGLCRLWKTYQRMGVKYCSTQKKLVQSEARQSALKIERKSFAKKLASLLYQRKPVIFADESSTRIWDGKDRLKKTWQLPEAPIPLRLNRSGLKSVQMIGACTNFSEKLLLSVYPSSDHLSWKQFLLDLKRLVDESHIRTKPVLVIDNLSVHKTKSVQKYY